LRTLSCRRASAEVAQSGRSVLADCVYRGGLQQRSRGELAQALRFFAIEWCARVDRASRTGHMLQARATGQGYRPGFTKRPILRRSSSPTLKRPTIWETHHSGECPFRRVCGKTETHPCVGWTSSSAQFDAPMPMGSMPMGSMPMAPMPMGSMPMGSMPMGSISLGADSRAAGPDIERNRYRASRRGVSEPFAKKLKGKDRRP